MNSRERVLTALRHEEPDLVPVTLAYETPAEILQRYRQSGEGVPIRQDVKSPWTAWPAPPENVRERWFAGVELPDDVNFDAFGVARWHSQTGESHGILGPLRQAESVEEILDFPWPNPLMTADFCAVIDDAHRDGLAVKGNAGSLFEHAWYVFGMERFLMALYENRDVAEALVDRLAKMYTAHARALAKAGVDIIAVSDDIASQNCMMISPDLWRELFKPRFAAIIAAAREVKPGMPVFYHSCGNVTAVIDDLIEIGVTILNPVQPEAMNPYAVKQRYGDQLTLWGVVGTQTVLPRGTPAEVRQTVREYCEILGKGGGFVIGPSHAIKEDVPWCNLEAFYRAVEEFGVYEK
jgi:uroporphyrinogen decarboxylase